MQPGDVLADRFEVEALVAAGGMGRIFRARDRQSGEKVAVKVLLDELGAHGARFDQETRVLAELSHPGIVRHVAHGVARSGEAYLAMEWLEGEDLSRRLSRGRLSIEESLSLCAQVAAALGAAHARGIVHRDLKPSNLFLVSDRIDCIKVLDFGIARLSGMSSLTQTGAILGTPRYMAPEQAQNEGSVDARADIFSLGCVLFECIAGAPAFSGDHMVALLAKVLFADPVRLADLCPEVPEPLERLVSRMMAKDPSARPWDGAALLLELSALKDELHSATSAGRFPISLTAGERRTLSVVVVEADPVVRSSDAATVEKASLDQTFAAVTLALRSRAETFGGRLEHLRDGSVVVTTESAGLATDQAARAARCALWLRDEIRGRGIALATGRSGFSAQTAAVEVIDRAAKILVSRAVPIAIDETTAGLLDGRFDVREDEGGLTLHGAREIAGGARLLLKKPTACVGRDRELNNLAQMFAECVEESQAQAALVTAAAGMGKSRLVHELVARLEDPAEPMSVWIARGDFLRAGSALSLLAQALRGAMGIRGDEPLAERQDKLSKRVASRVGSADRQRVTEFLAEIIGAPFPDDESELLGIARRNPPIMTDQLRRAWLDFFSAELESQPVLIVLEDLHWGDLPTVQLIDAALSELAGKPWMVLAIARPEVHEVFPKLWAGRHVQEIALKPLGKKASERLVRQVLGDEIGSETVERIVARADGNAFYLEELIRAAAERKDERFPETVVAMVESRLATLDDADRRVLRAASVFGETFWPGGVALLLDGAEDANRARAVRRMLVGLVEREVLVRRDESRFSGQEELAFRHVLLREGAYAMLTAEDLALGHKLAGEWLERSGEREPRLLAEHFDLGGEAEKAAMHYLRAAEQAFEGSDFLAALELSERGRALAPEGEHWAGLSAVQADARLRSGDLELAMAVAKQALHVARPGSRAEGRALSSLVFCAMLVRDADMLQETMERLDRVDPDPGASSMLAAAVFSFFSTSLFAAQRDMAEGCLRRLEHILASATTQDPIVMAWTNLARGICRFHIERDPWGLLTYAQDAVTRHERSGAGPIVFGRMCVVGACAFLGDFEQTEEEARRALAITPAGGPEALLIEQSRCEVLIAQRKLAEALGLAERCAQETETMGDGLVRTISRLYRMEAQWYGGNVEAAEAEASALSEVMAKEPLWGMWYLALLARMRLEQGRADEALELSERAYAQSKACRMGAYGRHALLLLIRAEAHDALGHHDAARDAIREARDDLLRRAACIPDTEPDLRRGFLENFPDHRRTLELARAWLGESS